MTIVLVIYEIQRPMCEAERLVTTCYICRNQRLHVDHKFDPTTNTNMSIRCCGFPQTLDAQPPHRARICSNHQTKDQLDHQKHCNQHRRAHMCNNPPGRAAALGENPRPGRRHQMCNPQSRIDQGTARNLGTRIHLAIPKAILTKKTHERCTCIKFAMFKANLAINVAILKANIDDSQSNWNKTEPDPTFPYMPRHVKCYLPCSLGTGQRLQKTAERLPTTGCTKATLIINSLRVLMGLFAQKLCNELVTDLDHILETNLDDPQTPW